MAWKLAGSNGHDNLKYLDAANDAPVFGNDACSAYTSGPACNKQSEGLCRWSRKVNKKCSAKNNGRCWWTKGCVAFGYVDPEDL